MSNMRKLEVLISWLKADAYSGTFDPDTYADFNSEMLRRVQEYLEHMDNLSKKGVQL